MAEQLLKLNNFVRETYDDATKQFTVSWDLSLNHTFAKSEFEFRFISKNTSGASDTIEAVIITPAAVGVGDKQNTVTCVISATMQDGAPDSRINNETKDKYFIQARIKDKTAGTPKDPSDWTTELNWYMMFKMEAEIFQTPVILSAESGQTRYGLTEPFILQFDKVKQGLETGFGLQNLPNEILGKNISQMSVAVNELDFDTTTKEFNIAVVANLDMELFKNVIKVKRAGIVARRSNLTHQALVQKQAKLLAEKSAAITAELPAATK